MRGIPAVLLLRLVALAATLARIRERGVFTYLGPVCAIYLLGSVTVVSRACGPRG